MRYEPVKKAINIIVYFIFFLLSFFAVHATATSMHEMPPKGEMRGNPPPGGGMGQAPPMMGAAKLKDKEQSDYFTDLTAETAAINSYVDYLFKKKLIKDPSCW
nr:hypothetical protein [uncultured Desulfobacter sp.]